MLVVSAVVLPWAIGKLGALRSTQSWLLARGARTSATVEKIEQVGGEACAVYDITFTAQNGKSVQIHSFQVLPEANPHPGEQITVAYDPSHPTLLRSVRHSCGDPYGQWHWWAVSVMAGLAIPSAAAILLALGWHQRSPRRRTA